MTIRYACPACDARLYADDEMIGQTTFCSRCGKPAIVDPGTVPAAPGLDGKDTELKSLLLLLAGIAVSATVLAVAVGAAIRSMQDDAAVTTPAAAPPLVPAVRKTGGPASRAAAPAPNER